MHRNKFFKLILLIVLCISLWWGIGYTAAYYISSRRNAPKELPIPPFVYKNIELKTTDNSIVSAWIAGDNFEKAVIILTGIGGNRRYNIERAQKYLDLGYSVLLPDLRGTGLSGGDLISYGWHERLDLLACYQYLKKSGIKEIGVHGSSLGAATILYSLEEKPDYSFIILESCYDNIDNAFKNRVKNFSLPEIAYFPMLFFTEQRIKTKRQTLYPEIHIRNTNCPILIMAGDSEAQIKIEETEKLFSNCGSKDKELHIFKSGKHEDFLKRFPEEYNVVFKDFLGKRS